MNANELADDLDYASTISEPRIQMMGRMKIAATMLRQQQAEIDRLLTIAEDFQMLIVKQKVEIEALKMEIHSLTYGERLAEYLKKAKG